MGPGRVSVVELFGDGSERVLFTDDDGVEVGWRIATIRVSRGLDQLGVLQRKVSGQLRGGRWSAGDIAGRRLRCWSATIGAGGVPCVVRTSGEIVFLPR